MKKKMERAINNLEAEIKNMISSVDYLEAERRYLEGRRF